MIIIKRLLNRAPQYAPSRGGSLLALGSGMPSNIEAQMKAYGTVGVLFAIVSRTAEAVAEADWGLYPIGADKDAEPDREHPAARLWEQPNAFMDQDTFIEAFMQHFDLAGEGDIYVSRASKYSPFANNQAPLELWPVRPDRLTAVPDPAKYLAGWVYQVPGGDPVPYAVQDIIQVKRPNPMDPYRGLAPIAAAMIDVYGERAASEYNANFFRNGALPNGMIEFDEPMQQPQYDEFVARWNEQHQGSANAHKVGIIEGGHWIDTKYTLRDMQFEELRKLNREFIRDAYGYPKSMLGSTEDVNKAAAIAGEYVFVRWIVRPRLNRIQSVLNTQLLPMFGPIANGYEFRFTTPVPADKELEIKDLDSQAARVKTLVDAGYDPDDVLKYVGLPAMKYKAPVAAGGAPDAKVPPAKAPVPAALWRTDGGRPSRSEDPEAREIWDKAMEIWGERPKAPMAIVADMVGVHVSTLRRYKDAFSVPA